MLAHIFPSCPKVVMEDFINAFLHLRFIGELMQCKKTYLYKCRQCPHYPSLNKLIMYYLPNIRVLVNITHNNIHESTFISSAKRKIK